MPYNFKHNRVVDNLRLLYNFSLDNIIVLCACNLVQIISTCVWGIVLNQAIMVICGGEMNFILGSLSIMVMIFTLSIAVHVVSYHSTAKERGETDPLSFALNCTGRSI